MIVLILDFILLVVLLILGLPLPFCFGGAIIFVALFTNVSIKGLILWGFSQMISPTLLAGPIFIYAGTLISESGIANKLIDLAKVFVGRIKGSLGVISVVTCGFIGAISGSGFTGIAAVGPALLPRMLEDGYPKGYTTALITCSTVLGVLIPPSITQILYGWLTGTSILACFLSTVGPGVLLIVLLSIINLIDIRRFSSSAHKTKFAKADAIALSANKNGIETKDAITFSINEKNQSKLHTFRIAIPGLMMPIIILGGIYGGVFTPTEAAAVAAIVAMFIGFVFYKQLKISKLFYVTRNTATSIGAIFTMIFFCLILSQAFVLLRMPQQIIEVFMNFTDNKIVVLLIVNVFLIFVGMIVNDGTAIILLAPLLLPLMVNFGVSPVQFAAIMVLNLGMGGLTPPYASLVYLGMRICDCKFEEMAGPVFRFILLAFLPVLILTTYWPPLTLWLPNLLGY